MLEVGIAVCLIMLGAAGYLAYRNSRLIAEMKQDSYIPPPSSEYTVYMTTEFSEEDLKTLVPLGFMEYRDADGVKKAGLCRIRHDSEGDLKLEEAGMMLLRHIRQAREKGTFISYRSETEALTSDAERKMADRLAEAAAK
ncbi:hypothetical protein [Paenibacillus sp. DMB20]|uniref:hypothetical protein n=1 Tax=Paenibacillus sp. DMB20 TaxID=1642570 RepID=UPI0006282803|nr:hypothetical protein [Paenibacillus sp. DMB20]KKO54455.1 hypothetical protein XI25_06485 [Paenibacillus sp. DMB20]